MLLSFAAALSHLRETRFVKSSMQTVLLAVALMFPVSLQALEVNYYYQTDDGIVLGLEVNGILYEENMAIEGYDYYGYVVGDVQAQVVGYSTSHPITYDQWNPDSTITIGAFYLDTEEILNLEGSIDSEIMNVLLNNQLVPVTSVREGAFRDCPYLRNVVISSEIVSVGDAAFKGSSVKTVDIEYDKNHKDIAIGKSCFSKCSSLETLQINKYIEEIPYAMCLGCPSLTFVVLSPGGPIKIGALAFANCTSLPYFDASNAVEVIGKGAFVNCFALQNIWMPRATNTAKTIGDYAFGNCYSLAYYDFNNVLESIGDGAFVHCHGLTNITIPSSITSIGEYTFTECENLTDVKLHDALTSIGQRAFSACYQLKGVEIPNSVTSIGEAAFSGARAGYALWSESSLTDTTFLKIASSFEQYGIDEGGMKRITIGNSLDTIANYTFGGQVPDTIVCMTPVPPVWMGTYVFTSNAYSNSVLCVPRVLVESYAAAPGWENFQHIAGIEVLGNGDVTGNGTLDVTDAIRLISMVLNNEEVSANADLNGDGQVNVTDITILINTLLNAR